MPVFRSAGGSAILTGRGGVHPGVIDATPGSSAAGSLGTSTLSGNGQTIAATSASSVSGNFVINNPWFTGAGNTTYSIASGSLPPGFSLNTSTGAVSGSYTVAGWNEDATYSFTVRGTSVDGLHTNDRAYTIGVSVPFLYKQIITTGYVIGGYINSVPFRNVHGMNNATDVTTNRGDLIGAAAQYTDGFPAKDNSYVFGTSDSPSTGSNRTDKWAMRTDTAVTFDSSRNMPGSKDDLTVASTLSPAAIGYIFGGGSASIFKFTSSNDTTATIPATSTAGSGSTATGTGSFQGELSAIITPGANRFTFSTETNTNIAPAYPDVDGQQKGLSTKLGFGYMGNEGGYAAGYNFRKWNFSTSTYGVIGKPAAPRYPGGYGEENMIMGQNWGYIMGHYCANESGGGPQGQVSDCIKMIYPTDTGYYMGFGATSAPGGFNVGAPGTIGGRSSGGKSWRD